MVIVLFLLIFVLSKIVKENDKQMKIIRKASGFFPLFFCGYSRYLEDASGWEKKTSVTF